MTHSLRTKPNRDGVHIFIDRVTVAACLQGMDITREYVLRDPTRTIAETEISSLSLSVSRAKQRGPGVLAIKSKHNVKPKFLRAATVLPENTIEFYTTRGMGKKRKKNNNKNNVVVAVAVLRASCGITYTRLLFAR